MYFHALYVASNRRSVDMHEGGALSGERGSTLQYGG